MKFPKIAHDKQKHLIVGFVLFFPGLLGPFLFRSLFPGVELDPHLDDPLASGLAASALVGLVKEVWDIATGKGRGELLDFIATALGGCMALGTLYAFGLILALSGSL